MSAAATAIAWGLALGFAGATAWSAARVANRQRGWVRTQGTVASITRQSRYDTEGDRVMYAPVVRFHAGGRGDVTFQDDIWSDGPSHAVGERVPVLYDPGDPNRATLAGWRPYFGTLLLAFATFVMGMIGVIGGLAPPT